MDRPPSETKTLDGDPFTLRHSLVAISDFHDGWPPAGEPKPEVAEAAALWLSLAFKTQVPTDVVNVRGGYLERLPLACMREGLVDRAEVWHHWRPADPGPSHVDEYGITRRGFRVGGHEPPFSSNSMRGFIQAFGAPRILCVWGLGVDAALLDDCADSFKIYNSIDAPALRIPEAVSARFDLVLTAAEWQSDEVRRRHPDMPCAVLPIGPDFADPDTFRPLGLEKIYDAVYVAAAQPYKRHDLLFDSLEQAPRRLRVLCVFGYGEMADDLRRQALARDLDVDFIGPPGVGFAEVNRLMNQAKVGVVCGVDDGAPAILTEYMLAGLPVLANADLRCGLPYILPETGRIADAASFGTALARLADEAPAFASRQAVLDRWTWPHSVARLRSLMAETPKGQAMGFGTLRHCG